METMSEKRVAGFEKIFEIAEDDMARARRLLDDAGIVPSDVYVLIGYMVSASLVTRELVEESIMGIAEALSLDTLIGLMVSNNYLVAWRLITKLAESIPVEALESEADVLAKWGDSGEFRVRELVELLNEKINIAKRTQEEDAEILELFKEGEKVLD